MFKEIFKEMYHPSKAAIISSIKRSDGLPVSDVAKEVEMSYMGVKQHCINLEKLGFLESWRVPRKEVGRPEKLYKLTAKCDDLFPVAGSEFTIGILEGVKDTFGEDAPEKLLRKYFSDKESTWSKSIPANASIKEKAEAVSTLREEDGVFNTFSLEQDNLIKIKEYHNPLAQVIEQYPFVAELEHQMLETLIGTKLEKSMADGPHGQQQVEYGIQNVA